VDVAGIRCTADCGGTADADGIHDRDVVVAATVDARVSPQSTMTHPMQPENGNGVTLRLIRRTSTLREESLS